MERRNIPGTNINNKETEEARGLGVKRHTGELSGPPDRPNVATKHNEGVSKSDMAPRVEPVRAQGEPTEQRVDTNYSLVLISLCARHGLYNTSGERRSAPNIRTARVQDPAHGGNSGERIPRKEDNSNKSIHKLHASVEQTTRSLVV
jgi:hypothetical protein